MGNFKSIRNKILVLFIVQSLLISTVLILLSQIYSTKIMMDNLEKNSFLLLSASEKGVSQWFAERRSDIESLALLDEVKSMDWNRSEKILKSYLKNKKGVFLFLFVADLNGDYSTTMIRNAGNISDREYFPQVIGGETIISGPLSSKSTKKLISVIAAPIKDENGKVVGLLAGAVSIDTITELIDKVEIAMDDSYSFLIDKNGNVIAHPDRKLVMNLNFFTLQNVNKAESIALALDKKQGRIKYQYKDKINFALFSEIEGTDSWKIITKISTGYIKKPLYIMAFILIITMAFSTVLVVFVGLFLSKKISDPIRRLREIFEKGVKGDLTIRADIKTNDEIGEASECFNKLMDMSNDLIDEVADTGRELQDYIDNILTYNCKIALDGTIKIINETMASKLVTGKESLIGKKIWELEWFSHSDGAVQRTKDNVRSVLGGDTIRSEETIKRGDHGFVAIEYTMRMVKNREGLPAYIILEARDVTERIMLESEVLNMKKLESIGILAGGIAHDFNNIMTGILGMLSLAKYYTKDGDEIREKIETAEKATLKAKDLTQQLLTFSKGGAPLKRTLNISNLLKESVDFVLRGSNVKSEIIIQPNILPVDVDEGQINQVFSNIIINARQAMPGGGRLNVVVENFSNEERCNPILDRKKYIRIGITDTGTGMSDEIQKRIFDPYFTTKKDGSGLGLATSYSIIRKHDGHISVDSEPGKGATFVIFLPASGKVESGSEKAMGDKQAAIIKASDFAANGGSTKKRIIIMDDDDIVIKVAVGILKYWGYEVVTSADGLDAVLKIKEAIVLGNKIDLAILDLTVPGGAGGKEVVGKIKEIDPEIKAIVSSGYSNDPVVAEFNKYGFDGVVSKPYIAEDLISAVKSLLS